MTKPFVSSDKPFESLIRDQNLPAEFYDSIQNALLPAAKIMADSYFKKLNDSHNQTNDEKNHCIQPLLWGLNGSQGSGKSTISQFLARILHEQYDLNCLVLSLDDFYCSQQERLELAQSIHPLLKTRGVPGTHRCHSGIELLSQLKSTTATLPCPRPAFNKATDELHPESQWPVISQLPNIVIFEGWCVGCPPQSDLQLKTPVNDLEEKQDSQLVWRQFVNQQLKTDYARWFDLLDNLIYLQIPSFDKVLEWRSLQEQKLYNRSIKTSSAQQSLKTMSHEQLVNFIKLYERLTRWGMETLPERADIIINIDHQHRMTLN